MALSYFVCTNCGYWQQRYAAPESCPVCLDVRHVPPENGWEFLTPGEIDGWVESRWEEVEEGIWRFTVEPTLGIGPVGYVIVRPEGNVAFEGADWYSDAALDHIESLGGVRYVAPSHPHAQGALWRLQERFGAEGAVQREDLVWVSTLSVGLPFDDRQELLPGLTLHHVGGHFDGQSMLHHEAAGQLFVGDALKVELEEDGKTAYALSCHKAFVRRIPLTHAEVAGYRKVYEALDFDGVFTTFEQGKNVGRAEVLKLLDYLLQTKPTMEPMPL